VKFADFYKRLMPCELSRKQVFIGDCDRLLTPKKRRWLALRRPARAARLAFESSRHPLDAWMNRTLEIMWRLRRRVRSRGPKKRGCTRRGRRPRVNPTCSEPRDRTRRRNRTYLECPVHPRVERNGRLNSKASTEQRVPAVASATIAASSASSRRQFAG